MMISVMNGRKVTTDNLIVLRIQKNTDLNSKEYVRSRSNTLT